MPALLFITSGTILIDGIEEFLFGEFWEIAIMLDSTRDTEVRFAGKGAVCFSNSLKSLAPSVVMKLSNRGDCIEPGVPWSESV